jgi:glutamate racemase
MRSVHQPTPAVQRASNDRDPANRKPIGVFDSGIGGLTVVKELMRQLPYEPIIYLGDTARVPYGTKSDRTIKAFTLQSCLFLLEHDVKMIVIACNTASSVALDFVAGMFRIPVVGVIEPGSSAAVQRSVSKRIGVIGTHTTVNSLTYPKTIHGMDPHIEVFSKACPLFVPLAEEGWTDRRITSEVSEEYLKYFEGTGIDTLVMGCTHYPLLAPTIHATMDRVMRREIALIDSGVETARLARSILVEHNLLNTDEEKPGHKFFVTDRPKNFERVGEMFLGAPIDHLDVVNVEVLGF